MSSTSPHHPRLTSFSSWIDRIPFVVLFGIATSVDLFHERLSRAASRCLYGAQFDVEQTSLILERVFQNAVAGSKAPLRLGPVFVSSLMERQHDHVQSVQAFTTALKVVLSSRLDERKLTCIVCIYVPFLCESVELPQ